MTRRIDKAVLRTLDGLLGQTPLDTTEALFTVAEVAGRERALTIAAKAVLKASNGTDGAAMDEALDQLRKALK
jgi:hypothetical protein